MLVLNRKANQTVMISDHIQVKILKISGGDVLISFDAPISIPVDREEVYKRKQLQALNRMKYSRISAEKINQVAGF